MRIYPGYYEEDGMLYKQVFGPGSDIPCIVLGPGFYPEPMIFGPLPEPNSSLEETSKLAKKILEDKNKIA